MSGLTIDQSKNKGDVFGEIRLHNLADSEYNNWTITDFTFDPPIGRGLLRQSEARWKCKR